MAFADKIIDLIKNNPGLSDRELTDILKETTTHPSQVNQEARLLESKGILIRTQRPDGKIGNFLGQPSEKQPLPVHSQFSEKSNESKKSAAIPKEDLVILLSCVKSKRTNTCAAKDMYISPLFQGSIAVAKNLSPKKIFILSAKYGLLKPEDIIEPYEKTLKNMQKPEKDKWNEDVISKLEEQTDFQNDHYVFFAGLPYREGLIPRIQHYSVPMEGLSFGRQLQWLKAQLS